MLGTLKRTHRGFRYYQFKDRNGYCCSLQKSSIATEHCIWLGVDSPEQIEANTRMHLTMEQAGILGKQLLIFAETGEIPAVPREPHFKKETAYLSAESAVTAAADAAAIALEQCRLRYSAAAKHLRALDRLKESLGNKPLGTKSKLL